MSESVDTRTVMGSLIAAFVVGGIVLFGMTRVNSSEIESLKENQMSKELIEVKLDYIIESMNSLKTKVVDIDEKLIKHINETT